MSNVSQSFAEKPRAALVHIYNRVYLNYVPQTMFRIHHFRTHHVTNQSQISWPQNSRLKGHFELQGHDERTTKKNHKPLRVLIKPEHPFLQYRRTGPYLRGYLELRCILSI